MKNIYIIATIICSFFIAFKLIEKYSMNEEIKKEYIKRLVKDTLIVYLASVAGLYLVDELYPTVIKGVISNSPTQVFTDTPSF